MAQFVDTRFRELPERWDRHEPWTRLPRHRHGHSHIVVVVSGSYEEAGDSGRRWVSPGSVLVQKAFQAHANAVGAGGANLLCLPLDREVVADAGVIDCLDEVVRQAATDVCASAALVLETLKVVAPDCRDWPDDLAAALRSDANFRISDWAAERGLSRETVSRGFRRAFGASPRCYRADARALRAWRALRVSRQSLSAIAVDHGFADQAHMTREVRRVTGVTPGAWRRPGASPVELGPTLFLSMSPLSARRD